MFAPNSDVAVELGERVVDKDGQSLEIRRRSIRSNGNVTHACQRLVVEFYGSLQMRRRREISEGILASRGCCWVGVGTDCMLLLRTEWECVGR